MAGTANLTIILSAKDSATQALRALGTAFSDTTVSSRQLRIEFLQAEQRAASLAQRAKLTGTELSQLKADQAAANVAQLGQQMEATTSRASLMGVAIGALGAAVAAAALSFGALAAKMAAGFETATVELQNQAQLTKAAAAGISDALLQMGRSSEFGGKALVEALTPVAGRLESVTGSALTTAQALEVMRGASDLAEASNSALGEATNALINVMLAYQLPLSQAADTSDKLFNISRVTGIGLSEMATAVDRLKDKLGNSAPDLTQMGALLAELSSQGISGSRGLLAVSGAIENLTSGSDKVNTTLHNLGVGVFDAQGSFIGLRNVIAELTPIFAKMSDAQQNEAAAALFGAGASGVLLNVIKGGTGAFDNFADRISATGTAAQAAAADNATFAVQMKVFRNDISALTTAFGQQLLPVLEKFTGVLTPITDALVNNETAMKAIAIVAGGVVVAGLAATAVAFYALIPPAVAAAIAMNAAFLFIPVAIAAVIAALYLLVANWQTVKDNIGTIARDIVIFFSPTGPLGLIIAHWKQIFDLMPKPVQDAMNKVAGIVSGIVNFVVGVINGIINAWNSFGPVIIGVATLIFGPVILAITAVAAAVVLLKQNWDAVWGAMTAIVQTTASVVAAIWGATVSAVIATWSALSAAWSNVWGAMTALVQVVAGTVESIWAGVVGFLENAWGAISGAWSAVWSAFPDPVQSALSTVGNIVASAVQGMIDLINKFLSGLDSIASKVGGLLSTVTGGLVNIDLSIPTIPSVGGFQLSGGERKAQGEEPVGRFALDQFSKSVTNVGNAAAGALPEIQGVVPALAGGGGGGKGGGVAGAASQATKDLVALSAAFQRWHAQTGGDAAAFGEYLDAQKLVGQETQAVADTARQGRVELRALAIVLGQAGISGEAFIAQTGLRALATAFQNFGGTVAQFVNALHGLSQSMLSDASSLAAKLGKPILSFNTGAEGYVDQYGVRHTGGGNVDPTGYARLPDWLKDFLKQHPTDTKITTPYAPDDPRNRTLFPGITQAKPTVNYYGPVTVNTTENASQTLATMAMAVR